MENSVNQNVSFISKPSQQLHQTPQEVTKTEEKEEALLDFSSMFKKNGFAKRPMPKLGAQRKTESQTPNWLLQIPAKLEITIPDLQQRRFMNQQKWKIMTKTNKFQNTSLAAVLSSINYLIKTKYPENFTQIKLNELKEKVLECDTLKNQSSRRQLILESIKLLKQEKKLSLDVKIHELQQVGKNREFLGHVLQSLKESKKAFIYVSFGYVFCVIGYENTPLVPLDAYKKLNQINPEKMELWFILASVLKSQSPFVIKRWTDIEKELTCRWPQYLDLQQAKKGIQTFDQKAQNEIPKNQQVSCWIQLTLEELNS